MVLSDLNCRDDYLGQPHPLTLAGQILTPVWPDMIAGIFQREGIKRLLSWVIGESIFSNQRRFNLSLYLLFCNSSFATALFPWCRFYPAGT